MVTKEEQRAYMRKWMANRRAAYFVGKSCVRCGSTSELQLDHIDPKTKIHHAIWSWSEIRRNSELAKCQVLCWPCHKIKTNEDHGVVLKHGTYTGYRTFRCRCEECRQWSYKDYYPRYLARKKRRQEIARQKKL